MPRVTILALLIVGLTTIGSMAQSTEFVFSPGGTGDINDALPFNWQNGVRGISGPYDLDRDGHMEMLLSQHTTGGRAYVIENTDVDTWELVYATPVLDSTETSLNARYAVGADVDGDGNWEIVFVAGNSYNGSNPLYTAGSAYIFEHDGVVGSDNYGTKPAFVADYYAQDPQGPFSGSARAERMEAADVDGDGRSELLIPSNGASAIDICYVVGIVGDIETDGYETSFATTKIEGRLGPRENGNAFGGGSPNAVVHGDFNGDGQMDIGWMVWNNFNLINQTVVGVDSVVSADTLAENNHYRPALALSGANDDVALFGGFVGDIDGDGNDEVYWPNYPANSARPNLTTIVDYDTGEDVLAIDADHVTFDALDLLGFGPGAVADVDGDGHKEVIIAGGSYTAADANAGVNPDLIHLAEYNGGDPGDPASYGVEFLETPFPIDEGGFNTVTRDSAGVVRQYYETALSKQGTIGNHQSDPIFPSSLVYFGDADGDGSNEIAISFQGVDDTLQTINELYRPDSLRGVFNTPDGADSPGPILPGQSYSFSFGAAPGSYFSFETMFGESNDLFYAPADTGIALWDSEGHMRSGDVTSEVWLWDAGTELNEEPFVGPNQAPRQDSLNAGAVDTLSGVTPCCVDGYTYPAVSDVIEVTLAADEGSGVFTVTIMNVSTAGKSEAAVTGLAPGVYVIGPAVPELFESGSLASAGLERAAEDGDPTTLNAALLGNYDLINFRTITSQQAADVRSFVRVYSLNGRTVSAENDRIILPSDYKLSGNYPNPFNPTTNFSFTLPIDKKVSVKIYDVMGRLVSTLVNDELLNAGTHQVTWNGRDVSGQTVASGQYIYTLEYGNFRQSRTMVLLK
ncbi:MAG: spondin domain-containing protein [Rhodothermales bacterium]